MRVRGAAVLSVRGKALASAHGQAKPYHTYSKGYPRIRLQEPRRRWRSTLGREPKWFQPWPFTSCPPPVTTDRGVRSRDARPHAKGFLSCRAALHLSASFTSGALKHIPKQHCQPEGSRTLVLQIARFLSPKIALAASPGLPRESRLQRTCISCFCIGRYTWRACKFACIRFPTFYAPLRPQSREPLRLIPRFGPRAVGHLCV